MSAQPIMLIITPETVLDVYLEYGMPQDLYDQLSEVMDSPAKESLAQLTIIGLNELNGKMPVDEALYMIMLALLELSNTNLCNVFNMSKG